MEFEREIHEQYQKAYALGMKNLQDKKKQRLAVCPAALNTLLDEKMVSYRVDLGVMEIPTNLIIGVSNATEEMMLYTKEFLPISVPNSDFADCWRVLYKNLNADHSFAEEISCYEYLGKFYVIDGLKRVSVAKYMGLSTIRSQVIRILPMRTDAQEVVEYVEFLSHYRHTKLYQLQFTQKGYFEKLQVALGRKPGYRWSDTDRANFLRHWSVIEGAFRKSYEESLRITPADALVVLLNRYTYDQIISMDSWVLARIFQAFWKEMYTLSFPDAGKAEVIHSVEVLQTA